MIIAVLPLVLVTLLIFCVYNIYILSFFGIPENLSMTYYYLKEEKNKAFLFPLFILMMCCVFSPAWFFLNSYFAFFESQTSILIYIVCLMMFFLVLLSDYKEKKIRFYLHYTVAIISSVCELLWIFIVAYKYWYIPFMILFLSFLAAFFTKTHKCSCIYWLEITAFLSLFIVTFLLSLLL